MSNQDESKEDNPQEDRRSSDDRRSLHRSVSFPYKTKEGLVILKDRRKIPDRRINNISVEDTEITEGILGKDIHAFKSKITINHLLQ